MTDFVIDMRRDDPSVMLSHLLLRSSKINEIAETIKKNKKENGLEIVCTLQFNGIEVPAAELEDCLKMFWEKALTQIREKYDADNLDALVENRAIEMVNDYVSNLMDFEQYTNNLLQKFPEA